jgi:hypothetical protein
MSNTRLFYFLYLTPLFMTFVVVPTQIQGQSITDETTGASTSNTTSGGGDRDLNCTPGYPCMMPEDETTGASTSNTTDVKCMGASDDPANCRMDNVCIGGPDEPLNCREVPFVPSDAN